MISAFAGFWELFVCCMGRLAAIGFAVSLLGWFAVRCRVSLQLRIAAGVSVLALLFIGGLLVLILPALELRDDAVPVMTAVLEKTDHWGEGFGLPARPHRDPPPSAIDRFLPAEAIAARSLAAGVWLAGIVLGLAWLCRDVMKLRRHLGKLPPASEEAQRQFARLMPDGGFPSPITFLLDPSASGPCSCRWRRSILVLPASWLRDASPGQLSIALAHERAHLRHRDTWLLLAWRLATILWWWNPLIHFLAAQAEEICEWRADAEAVSGKPDRAAGLARALIEIVSVPAAPCLVVQSMAATSARRLQRRLRRLLDSTQPGAWTQQCHRAALLLVILACVAVVSGCALPGYSTRFSRAFVNGEIIHTTPDAWPGVTAKFPVTNEGENFNPKPIAGSQAAAAARRHANLTAKAMRFGSSSSQVICIEIKLIESKRQEPAEASPASRPQIFTSAEAAVFQRKLLRELRSKATAWPRCVVRSGNPVAIRSVVNWPMLIASRSEATPTGGKTTATIGHLPVGTMFLLCPVITREGKIHIETDFTLSQIIGEEKNEGNPYPVISAWFHQSGLDLHPGESVLISGPQDESGTQTDILVTASIIPDVEDDR